MVLRPLLIVCIYSYRGGTADSCNGVVGIVDSECDITIVTDIDSVIVSVCVSYIASDGDSGCVVDKRV